MAGGRYRLQPVMYVRHACGGLGGALHGRCCQTTDSPQRALQAIAQIARHSSKRRCSHRPSGPGPPDGCQTLASPAHPTAQQHPQHSSIPRTSNGTAAPAAQQQQPHIQRHSRVAWRNAMPHGIQPLNGRASSRTAQEGMREVCQGWHGQAIGRDSRRCARRIPAAHLRQQPRPRVSCAPVNRSSATAQRAMQEPPAKVPGDPIQALVPE